MAEVAQQMGLDHYLILHPGQANHASLNTLATSLEAIFGAIHQDCGEQMSAVKAAMLVVGI